MKPFLQNVFLKNVENSHEFPAGKRLPIVRCRRWHSGKILQHRALVFAPDLKPIAEVDETYTSENLAFAPPH